MYCNDNLQSLIQGSVGETAVDLEILSQGFIAYYTDVNGAPIDRIIMSREGVFKTLEVKSCKGRRRDNNSYTVELSSYNGNLKTRRMFSEGKKIDILAVYLCDIKYVLFLDAALYKGKRSLSITYERLKTMNTSLASLFGYDDFKSVE